MRTHRIRELARRIYELQSFSWFADLIAKLKASSLSGASFEADVAALMMAMPGTTSIQKEHGNLSQDYDIDYQLGSLKLAVEVKTKDDDTAFSSKSVVNTIKGAAKQLPGGDVPGVLFLRVPPAWLGRGLDEDYVDALMKSTDRGQRATSRIAVVFSVIDKVHLAARKGRVNRVFDLFKTEHCSDDVWKWARDLKSMLDAEFYQMGPRAHF